MRYDRVKTGPSRRRAGSQGAGGIPSVDRRGPAGQAHSAGDADSTRGGCRSGRYGGTVVRSIDGRDSTTRRLRTVPSTFRTSADIGRHRPRVACPNVLPDEWTRRPQRWDASHSSHSSRSRISPGRAATRRGFPFAGRDNTQFPRWRGDAAPPRMMMSDQYAVDTSEFRGFRPPFTHVELFGAAHSHRPASFQRRSQRKRPVPPWPSRGGQPSRPVIRRLCVRCSGRRRCPSVREQLVELLGGPAGAELGEDIGEIRQRRDAVLGAGSREAVEPGDPSRRVM